MNYTDEQLRTMPLWDLVEYYARVRECYVQHPYVEEFKVRHDIVQSIARERIEARGKGEGKR